MNTSFEETTSTMMDELESDPIFLPSDFWRDINAKNVEMLQQDGLQNFKRTTSQNYYSWLITDPAHPQFAWLENQHKQHPTFWPFLTHIEEDIQLRLTTSPNPITLNPAQRNYYRLFVSYLWDTMKRLDKRRLHRRVSEPLLGNPIRITRLGRLITQDLANSILECGLMLNQLPPGKTFGRVAEIGAGSGRLAHVFAQTGSCRTYYIFDIPPALYLSQWYLSKIFPTKKIFSFQRFNKFDDVRREMEASDIVFLSANQIRKFPPDYFDLILTISTLPEMKLDQVKLYLDLFSRLSNEFVYFKQWKSWKNPVDNTDITIHDYDLGPNWTPVLEQTDLTNPEFFNQILRRTS